MAPGSVQDELRSQGEPLDAGARAFMERRFDRSFSDVRVHTGPQAAASAKDIGALAYTTGNHVVFGNGRYAPDTRAGMRLLAHELTHVVQQQSTAQSGAPELHIAADERSSQLEQIADTNANAIVPDGHASTSSALGSAAPQSMIQRQDDGGMTPTAAEGDSATATGGGMGGGGMTPTGGKQSECLAMGCPLFTRCDDGRVCDVIDCGKGKCPTCPDIFANLLFKAWCSFKCEPHGAAFMFVTHFGGFTIGPFCLD